MNLQAIAVSNGFAAVLLGILMLNRFMTRMRRRLDDKIFSAMILLALCGCAVEYATFYVDGRAGLAARLVNLLGDTAIYAFEVLITTLWVYYVDLRLYRNREQLRLKYRRLQYAATVMLALLVVNLFVGFVFSIDASNVYHRELGCLIYYVYFAVTMVVSIRENYLYQETYGRVQFFPIWMFLGPIIACGLVQAFAYGISLVWAGVALGTAAIYICLQNQQTFLDVLTGLYNRQFIEHTMVAMQQETDASYYGIMLDIDYFKQINDRFGHSTGDDALCEAANIFRRATMRDATAFRYAGDEFIIIMKTDDETDIAHMEDRIRGEMRRFNETTEQPYRLSFSMGHARYDRADTEDSFLKKMDDNMYDDKQRNHARLDQAAGA